MEKLNSKGRDQIPVSQLLLGANSVQNFSLNSTHFEKKITTSDLPPSHKIKSGQEVEAALLRFFTDHRQLTALERLSQTQT